MPHGKSRKAIRPTRQNLYRLWLIRSILLLALLAILTWLRHFSQIEVPWAPLWTLLILMALVNLGLLYRLWLPWPVGENEFFANLLLDFIFLTAVLYFTGGSSNPLVSYYLIPLIISAAVLQARYTWMLAVLSVSSYTLLFFQFVPFAPFDMSGHAAMMRAHLLGMWINFVFSAVLIAWFVVQIARSMHEQEAAISQIREAGIRDEQIINVAGIVAGTAHELRTPLATMTVLTGELKNEHPDLEQDLGMIEQQLERCAEILRELVSSTRQDSGMRTGSLAGLVADILDKWRIARPEVMPQVKIAEQASALELEYDQSLHHALLNFLHNAADESPEQVSLEARADGHEALIVIEDRGTGIPGDIADALGRRFVSRKDGGLGLGVLVSSASIERLHGRVKLLDREGGGTRWEVRLPVYRMPGSGSE